MVDMVFNFGILSFSFLTLSLFFLGFSSRRIHENYSKKDIQFINERSHLLMKSLPQGIFSKSDYNISFVTETQKTSGFLRVCYYVFGAPPPQKINASLCTHIIGAFVEIVNGLLYPTKPEDESLYLPTTDLKKENPHLKVMLSVGGGGNDANFSVAVSSKQNRMKLIQSAFSLLKKYNFDGLDVDWEFPVWNDGIDEDKKNFILFLKEFKSTAAMHFETVPLLSVAVAAPKPIVDESYDVLALAKYVDFINLMSYDYHDYTFYLPFTGHNSPLFNRSVEHAYFATLNTAWSAKYWYQNGMPLSKIMVGLPTYGHTYKLLDPKLNGFDAPATGFGVGNGSITYPEVCAFLANGGTRMFDKESQVPYAYRDYDWIAYDDYQSILSKAKWVKSKGFGGVMTFDLNCDDWQGVCDGKTTFPLHRIIYDVLTSS